MKGFIRQFAIVIGILLCGGLVGGFVTHALQPKPDKVVIEKTVTNDTVNAGRIKKDTANIILDGFRDMGKLVTYEYYYKEVDTTETQKDFWNIKLPWTKGGYTIAYDGIIDAGVDFSDISVSIDEKRNSIMVTIPDAEILNNTLDESSLEIYSESHNPFNQNQIEDFNDSLTTIKEAALERAIKNNILINAKKNAKSLVENFINSIITDNTYKIYYN